MTKFLRVIFSVFGLILIFNFVLWKLIEDKKVSRFMRYNELALSVDKEHYAYLITGDSHANDCWRNVEKRDDVLDFSFPGDNYIDVKRKLIYLESKGITFDYHLMEIDQQVFSTYRENTNNNDLSMYYEKTPQLLHLRGFFPLFFNPRVWEDITGLFKGSVDEELSNGETVVDTSSMQERAETQFLDEEFSNRMTKEFDKVLGLNIELDANAVFIKYPFYPSYSALISGSEVKARADSLLDAKIYSIKEVIVLNFEGIICDPSSLYNQDHVNARGASFVSKAVYKCTGENTCLLSDCLDRVGQVEEESVSDYN